MEESIQKTLKKLSQYQQITKKPLEVMLEEAVDTYILKIEKKIVEKQFEDEYNQTNLSFDEFWDGLD